MVNLAGVPQSFLVSFFYYAKDKQVENTQQAMKIVDNEGRNARLMVDSGAFSAYSLGKPITVKDYAAWLTNIYSPLGKWLVGCVNLDVLGDAKQSYRNWQTLKEAGHDTLPVTHLHDSPSVAEQYAKDGAQFIALGAMVGQSLPIKMRWAATVFKHIRERYPSVRFHGLGVGSQKIAEALPFYSIDSSGFGSAYRYGRLQLWDVKAKKFKPVQLDGANNVYRYGKLLRDAYNINPKQINKANKDNTQFLARVSARSAILFQEHLRKRNFVSPPAGLTDHGTHVHVVDGSVGLLTHMAKQLEA